jgi:hypothetical protein
MCRTTVFVVALISAAAPAADITLSDARQASDAVSVTPQSGRCSGVFTVTKQGNDDAEPVVWTAGTFKMAFSAEKLLLETEVSTEKMEVSLIAKDGSVSAPQAIDSPTGRVVILCDGDTVQKVTFSPRINPNGCKVELYSTIKSAISSSGFPLRNPVRPQLGVLDITKLIENLGPDAIEFSRNEGTLFRGVYHAKNSRKTRAVFYVDTAIDNKVVSHSVFNLPSELPVTATTFKWAKSKGVPYVHEYEVTKRYSGEPTQTEKVVYAHYEADPVIPPAEFDISSLRIPPGTRTIDRR